MCRKGMLMFGGKSTESSGGVHNRGQLKPDVSEKGEDEDPEGVIYENGCPGVSETQVSPDLMKRKEGSRLGGVGGRS